MKRIYLIIATLSLCIVTSFQTQSLELISQFSSSNYSEWSYNNSEVLLNAQSISGNKILIYNVNNKEYFLTSKILDLSRWESISIVFDWRAISYDQKEYDKTKNSPLVTILGSDNNETIDSHQYKIAENQLITPVSIEFQVKDCSNGIIKINAPFSDSNNTGSINKIMVYGNKLAGLDNVVNDKDIFKIDKNRINFYNLTDAIIKIINLKTGIVEHDCRNISGNYIIDEVKKGFYGISLNGKVTKVIIYD